MHKLFHTHKIKPKSRDGGFITLEIIVSMLIAFFFLMGSLQALVLATAFSVGARDDQRADKLIQEAVEELNDLGSNIALDDRLPPTDPLSPQAACNGNFNSTAGDGYGQALWNLLIEEDATTAAGSTTYTNTEDPPPPLGTPLTITGTQVTALGGVTSPTPHRILGINYAVTNEDGEEIANRYVEIIPDAALECS